MSTATAVTPAPINPAVAARTALVEDLRRYLVGPVRDDEVIQEGAFDRYHTGFLSPSGTPVDPEEDEHEAVEDDLDSGAGESILALANVSQQSAMGLTFQVSADAGALLLKVSWATYTRRETGVPVAVEAALAAWQREPFSCELEVPLTATTGTAVPLTVVNGIRIYAIVRGDGNTRTVTASVVNGRPAGSPRNQDDRIYQVQIRASTRGGGDDFLPRSPAPHLIDSEELWNFELLYRDHRQFAVGHGCSTDWLVGQKPDRAREVWTEWIPACEVFKASAGVLSSDPILLLGNLVDVGSREQSCLSLRRIPDAYAAWIVERRAEIPGILAAFPAQHHDRIRRAAEGNLAACERACERITEGIRLLETDSVAWRSFCLANEAMSRSMRQGNALRRPPRSDEPRWFAFQLAFILLTLPSVVDGRHQDRDKLDLIWFPTGGGKTEAYLGLSAFCIFHRRLAGGTPAERGGTIVLSRYTLRLLTVQQLERAARVVLACELIRRERPHELGASEISIGLFVGGNATPNRLEDAARILRNEADAGSRATTIPIPGCPWCRTRLQMRIQRVTDTQLITPCPGTTCPFRERIPVAIVDEELYAHPPSMVIGTIDKFARMAWVPEMRSLFGRGEATGSPPSLIIQDELHLISDSLGTIAALYETAIEHLCTRGGCGPKIIGSTATIRRAEEQCSALFLRKAVQFPPGGTLASSSFFYTEDREQPGRLYAGIHAQGRSPKHSLAWTVGTLCQGVTAERIADPVVRDQFHTLVMYFNSMRELGGALVLAADDVPAYMRRLCRIQNSTLRDVAHYRELSSQLKSEDIRDVLALMETSTVPVPGMIPTSEALDLLLSTNMISVGVDVDRLGVMIVAGQPKTTSEYIQASSRVGRPRGSAGLVVTLYNWTRPRDRSHYERFVSYHQSFYRHVESTSVTPFSDRARDRALHAVLVSLCRLSVPQLAANDSARQVRNAPILQQVRDLAALIVQRANSVDHEEAADTRAHLEDLIEEWQEEAMAREIVWSKHSSRADAALLRSAELDGTVYGLWPTPQSMRDVDPPSPVCLLTRSQLNRGRE